MMEGGRSIALIRELRWGGEEGGARTCGSCIAAVATVACLTVALLLLNEAQHMHPQNSKYLRETENTHTHTACVCLTFYFLDPYSCSRLHPAFCLTSATLFLYTVYLCHYLCSLYLCCTKSSCFTPYKYRRLDGFRTMESPRILACTQMLGQTRDRPLKK